MSFVFRHSFNKFEKVYKGYNFAPFCFFFLTAAIFHLLPGEIHCFHMGPGYLDSFSHI